MRTTTDLDVVYLMDDEGNEVEMTVLFTYKDDESNIDYIILFQDDENKELDELEFFPYRYNIIPDEETGEDVIDLQPIENDDEFNKMDEIINQYFEDLEAEENEK